MNLTPKLAVTPITIINERTLVKQDDLIIYACFNNDDVVHLEISPKRRDIVIEALRLSVFEGESVSIVAERQEGITNVPRYVLTLPYRIDKLSKWDYSFTLELNTTVHNGELEFENVPLISERLHDSSSSVAFNNMLNEMYKLRINVAPCSVIQIGLMDSVTSILRAISKSTTPYKLDSIPDCFKYIAEEENERIDEILTRLRLPKSVVLNVDFDKDITTLDLSVNPELATIVKCNNISIGISLDDDNEPALPGLIRYPYSVREGKWFYDTVFGSLDFDANPKMTLTFINKHRDTVHRMSAPITKGVKTITF